MATIGILAQRTIDQAEQPAAQFRQALTSRATIGQAKGVLPNAAASASMPRLRCCAPMRAITTCACLASPRDVAQRSTAADELLRSPVQDVGAPGQMEAA